MPATGLSIGYVLVLWWVSTGLILYLDGLPRWTFRWTILGATVLLVAGVLGLVASRDEPTVTGALTAFTSAVLVWGWNEVLFLTGALTGSYRGGCPEGIRPGRRFRLAASAILHHEIGLAASGLAVIALTWGGDNTVGAWTFAVLWIMRLSAKLNIFLGVPNVGAEFLPAHLAHLASFFRQAPMNPLFPASIAFGLGGLALLVAGAVAAEGASFERIAATLVATLLGLAVVEHLFMVLPIRSADLWRWGFASHAARPIQPPQAGVPGLTATPKDTTRGVP
ncbi:putative photosynthetic complex assembly protein PuhE [Prosthecomicrobium sp. N25]|uniref:putative photosynthetic complex assembly protein PuhE n=1 Tax=Prosthecomicrobium sp. N25 TaxID=3129254 RepID=UPI003077E031